MAAGYSGDAQVVLAGDVFYERQLAGLALTVYRLTRTGEAVCETAYGAEVETDRSG